MTDCEHKWEDLDDVLFCTKCKGVATKPIKHKKWLVTYVAVKEVDAPTAGSAFDRAMSDTPGILTVKEVTEG
jgi:hypothetical protein